MKNYYKTMLKRSIILITLFLGLIFALGTVVIWKLNLDLWVGVVFSVVIVGFQFIFGPSIIGWMYNVEFYGEPTFLKDDVLNFIEETCKKINIPVPKLGIIYDGNPNAFTYGQIPRNAKLVVTSGLIDTLTDEELKAVIAHELGHIKHYDFVLMMVVSLIPMILYQVYIKAKDNKSNIGALIGIGAYAVYVLSQFLVLSFSRIREYYADNFAKGVMESGEELKSALIKIAYGTACRKKYANPIKSTMGFTNNIQNDAFMLASYKASDDEKLDKKLMRWDVKSLWGKWYEINSTHPLTSKRITALTGEKAENSISTIKDVFKFLSEAFIKLLPWITLIIVLCIIEPQFIKNFKVYDAIKMIIQNNPIYISVFGASILVRYYYSYGRGYESKSIYELLSREDASPVKGIPAVLEGKIIGRGIPGLFFCEDLVIDDGTGIMLVDYRQPIKLIEFLFGTFEVEKMKEWNVKVVGWYKRGMRPYFVCRYILLGDRKIRSYNYILTEIVGYLFLILGVMLALL